MKKAIKKICIFALALSTSLSITISANAAKTVEISGNGNYNKYVTCTLRNKRSDAEIWVQCWNTVTSANDIKMTNSRGGHIWSQRRAISIGGCRKFRLGCDNSAYRIYLKTYVNYGRRSGGTANIWGNNVTIK